MTKKFLATLWEKSVLIFNQEHSSFSWIEVLYKKPIIDSEKEFDANLKIEDDEWFYIQLSDEQKEEMLWDYFKSINWSGSTNLISISDYEKIKALYFIEKEDQNINILFSKVFPKQKIQSSDYIVIDWDPSLKKRLNSIDINWTINAYWNWEKLYFKNYKTIMSLFPWISDFYITATPEQKDSFLENGFFNIKKQIKVWERNLKRIAYILKEKNIDFTNNEIREKYKKYSERYEKDLVFDSDNKVDIEDNINLTTAIQVIEEHFYRSEITWEPREAEHSKVMKGLKIKDN